MNIEQNLGTPSLAERAAIHAALGDPSRLQIVDTLLISDASPSELAAMLEMPSNLLAHHLKALEAAGIVSRHSSEGDRRRSYLRLEREQLVHLVPRNLLNPERVVFVCTANSARSHLAAALWRKTSKLPTASAGTHPASEINPDAVAAAKRHRLRMPRTQPQHVDHVLTEGDLVVTVCDRAHEELSIDGSVHWSVPDPVLVGNTAAFDSAYQELAKRVDHLSLAVSNSR